MIRRLVTMSEAVDVKAGIRNVLERIDVAVKSRPDKVNSFSLSLLQNKNKLFLLLVQKPGSAGGCQQDKARARHN